MMPGKGVGPNAHRFLHGDRLRNEKTLDLGVAGFRRISETDSPLALFSVVAISSSPSPNSKSIHVYGFRIALKEMSGKGFLPSGFSIARHACERDRLRNTEPSGSIG